MNTLAFFAYSYRLFGLAFRFCCCAAGGCGKYYGKNRRGKRNRARRKRGGRGRRPRTEEANERWREERNRRSDDLRDAWRRNHPSEQKKFGKGQPKKRPPA